MKEICIVITASMNLHSLYRGQFTYLINNGYNVTAIASPGVEHEWIRDMGVNSIELHISREPDMVRDFKSFLQMFKFFYKNRFDVIVVSTPKASLIGALAAKLSLQKNIIYMIRGRAYENFSGFKRKIFSALDKLTCSLSNTILSISIELKDKYIQEGLCHKSKIFTLGRGSSNGVDLNKFNHELFDVNDKASIRKTLQIPMEATVFVYCGRLRKEKGTDDLVNAFINLKARTKKSIHLLLLGKYEAFDSVSEVIKEYISLQQDITLIDWSREVEKYFAISDVFVFPSYREGFGNVAIEASAMKLPVIGYDVVGLRESIDNHCSGLLVPKSNVFLLSSAMEELLNNDGMRKRLGENGRGIVESFFSNQVVWENLLKFYNKSIVD